jgi:hypothetical protein
VDVSFDQLLLRAASGNAANLFNVSDTDVIHISEHLVVRRGKTFVSDESPQEQHLRIAIFDLLKFNIVQQCANITSAQHCLHESPQGFLKGRTGTRVCIRKNPHPTAREPEQLIKQGSRLRRREKSE